MYTIREFLIESNAIEGIYGDGPLADSSDAWWFLEKQKKLTLKNILYAHKLILQNLAPQIAGQIRKCNVKVGGRLCPDWKTVPGRLKELLSVKPVDALDALLWHIEYERLHPFEDGNGRSGRLVYAWHCAQLGKNFMIFRNDDKKGYYDLF